MTELNGKVLSRDTILNTKEMAEILGVSEKHTSKLVREGRFGIVLSKKIVRCTYGDLVDYINKVK